MKGLSPSLGYPFLPRVETNGFNAKEPGTAATVLGPLVGYKFRNSINIVDSSIGLCLCSLSLGCFFVAEMIRKGKRMAVRLP